MLGSGGQRRISPVSLVLVLPHQQGKVTGFQFCGGAGGSAPVQELHPMCTEAETVSTDGVDYCSDGAVSSDVLLLWGRLGCPISVASVGVCRSGKAEWLRGWCAAVQPAWVL